MRKTKTLLLSAAAGLMVIAIGLGSAFAWKDFTQHKTNQANGLMDKYNVRLVDQYVETEDWKTTDGPRAKEVYVKNSGKKVNGFGDVYVRIQLKEYMEIAYRNEVSSEKRYMIDENGDFISYASLSEVPSQFASREIKQLDNAVTGETGRYYIPTQEHDVNGEYGAFVTTKYDFDDPVAITGGTRAPADNHEKYHHEMYTGADSRRRNAECAYPVHQFNPNNATANPAMEYVKLNRNSGDIITYSEWIDPAGAYKGQTVAKWIIDDRAGNTNPWIYWGQALPAEVAGSDAHITPNFLNSIELIKQPDGKFYYALHIEMEAVSIHELSGANKVWGTTPNDIPEDLRQAYIGNDYWSSRLRNLWNSTKNDYQRSDRWTTASYTPFAEKWAEVETFLANEGTTNPPRSEYERLYNELDTAHQALVPLAPVVDKSLLKAEIATSKPIFDGGNAAPTYTTATWNNFVTKYNAAKTVDDDTAATQTQVDTAKSELEAARNALETILLPLKPGTTYPNYTIPVPGIIPGGNDGDPTAVPPIPYDKAADYRIKVEWPQVGGLKFYYGQDNVGTSQDWGYIQLENLLASTAGVGIIIDTKYGTKFDGKIEIGEDLAGKPSIVLKYLPTETEFKANLAPTNDRDATCIIPVDIKLTQGGKTSQTITLLLAYGFGLCPGATF